MGLFIAFGFDRPLKENLFSFVIAKFHNTHTHTQRERERKKERKKKSASRGALFERRKSKKVYVRFRESNAQAPS